MAPRNSYTLDGVELTDLSAGYFTERSTGIRTIPAKRMANIAYPALDGESFIPGATFSPGGVVVNMYVEGTDHQEFMERVEFLNGLFLQRHKLLELRHDYDVDNSVSRHAYVQVKSSTEVKVLPGMKSGTIEYLLEVPGAFWRSRLASDYTSTAVAAIPAVFTLTNLTGGNAPVGDALIRVKGGFSTMTLKDVTTGNQLVINTPLTATEYIIIDTKNWTARKVTTDTWDGGTVVDSSVISNRGMGPMMNLEPSIVSGALAYSIVASATNPASAPSFSVRAKKSYL